MRWTVDQAMAGRRLDAVIAAAGGAPSVAAARRSIAAGLVRVDGRRQKKGVRVQAGQVVEVAAPAAGGVASPEVPLVVLYEDADLVAVDKPAGVSSQSLRAGETGTVASALVARYRECAQASPDPREGGLGHRLDRDTSGVLVAARTRESWQRLRQVLGGGSCEKVYLAEVEGAPFAPQPSPFLSPGPRPGSWVVDAPVGRTGRRGSHVTLDGGRQPLAARTELVALEAREGTTLVEARLARGRPHQVRAHLAHVGHPVVGDEVYGRDRPGAGPLRLHALAVTFPHPRTGHQLRVEAPAPAWAKRHTA
jgi:23S rRNA pseudouridine1911/1915/1917 synthase